MTEPTDLTIVIPTRDRWPILRRTLAALADQTVSGFEIVVAVDGEDQDPPPLPGVRVIEKPAGGSASTRNAGMAAVHTPLALLLDDDMIPVPEMVERHLAEHAAHPDERDAVLGKAVWHPELGESRISRWLDRSGLMFDFDRLDGLEGTDVGWGRFCSCNVSFKTALFRRVGGFDETFVHYYEDTDLAFRLGQQGMRVFYEPAALTQHLQTFDWASVQRRFDRVALGERLMVEKHPGFEPWFAPMMRRALTGRGELPVWTWLADLPNLPPRVRRTAERRAGRSYLRRLAPSYVAAYERAAVWGELVEYLGDAYDPQLLVRSEAAVEAEEDAAPDEATFYRTSQMYLYDLCAFELSPTKEPYREAIRRAVPPGARILDYGCGIGSDGLALARDGYQVAFADFDNPSTAFLRWRLARRGLDAPVYDIDDSVPGGFDAVVCFDVIEHVEDPHAFLDRLESLAGVVAVNFLEPDPDDTHLHRPLPIADLIARARRKGLLHYRRHHGRSHLVLYRPADGDGPASTARYLAGRARSEVDRRRR